ncbi:GAF domain-containing protein [Herbihabitans rhizosphaerae]|uniref:GAF domain-containing protein n=1 Tax=Herbihabitans rhizosphaerae TaxID=1872711 RepID=A0A4Q7KHL9_9PSEU|nr:GAF and ANTAR domain-containing protein [Herbihabitans rhizosphaerae]RZS34783.1 GAF domain-containing protein [Herbihabitans rhizosphaerae]
MTGASAEQLAETLVKLADTLVDEFDLADFLHLLADRCVQLVDVDAAGILIVDPHGKLRTVGASVEQTRLIDLFELQQDEGPCLECYRTGEAVVVPDITKADHRWPEFRAAASAAGYGAVHALPMRLRTDVIGALNLFRRQPGALDEASTKIAQAMADVATIGLLQERALRRHETLAEQLQTALNSRVVIEQAKGVLSERLGLTLAEAFDGLRRLARRRNEKITRVATAVINGTIAIEAARPRKNA